MIIGGENMTSVQYVIDETGNPVAVQISITDWKLIKAELEFREGEIETAEILDDSELMASIKRGRKQKKGRIGKPLSEIAV
jgi:hypothetical protein